MSPSEVLDSWAVLAWLGDEGAAAAEVARLLDEAAAGRLRLSMCVLNAGEVFYCVAKRRGLSVAQGVRDALSTAPIELVPVDNDLVWRAAELKAAHPIAYADAFAAALALRAGCPLVTGDPELRVLEAPAGLAVRWLTR